MARDNRQTRAEQLTDVEVYELRDGVFALHCVNEKGEYRERILQPGNLYSSSPDMKYRHGVIGKYMRRLAMENEKARRLLDSAVRERIQELDSRANDIRQTADQLNRHMVRVNNNR